MMRRLSSSRTPSGMLLAAATPSAALKEKIIEAKNLGKGSDFDLLITNAQTGEEYSDDAFLVPKNTSVIIKRVAATRAKPVLRVDDQPRTQAVESSSDVAKGPDFTSQLPKLHDTGADILDDFGIDLYAIPEPQPSTVDNDENSRITAMINKTAADWERQTQETYSSGRGFGRLAYGRGLSRGRGYGRAVPPQGYVCHRCGQPGHFIQHCPTNGDPTYDIKRVKLPVGIPRTRLKADEEGSYIMPDGSVAVMQPDESVFAKEADALLSVRPASSEPQPELRCPLCQGIFRDAVMIPCCHYSFCDKCIRQELIEKGKCPQCGSSKFKNDDLLPNIALRQAIDRFLETQVPASSTDDAVKTHQVADLDSGPPVKAPSPTIRLQIELRKPSLSLATQATAAVEQETDAAIDPASENHVAAPDAENGSTGNTAVAISAAEALPASTAVVALVEPQPQCSEGAAIESSQANENVAGDQPATEKDAPGSVKEGGKHPVIDDGGGMVVKMSEPPSSKEAEVVAVESEFSKGKKKKKRTRLIPAGDGAGDYMGAGKGKRMQADRFCYICGSPEHLARDCLENPEAVRPPHPGMSGPGPGGMAGVMPPYGPEMYWHGPPMPPHGRPFPAGYGEGMYGPGPGPMPFDAPMMPGVPYGAPPYMAPMYPHPPMHSGFVGGGLMSSMGPMDRPLSREEFIELQERERRRRILQERPQRDWSPERPFTREGLYSQTPDSERRRYEHTERRGPLEEQHPLPRKRDLERDSLKDFSEDTDLYKSKSGKHERKHIPLVESSMYRRYARNSDDEPSFNYDLQNERALDRRQREGKAFLVGTKRDVRCRRGDVVEKLSLDPEEGTPRKSYSAKRHEKRHKEVEVYDVKCSNKGQSKRSDDGESLHVTSSGGDSHSGRQRSRRLVPTDVKRDVEYEGKSFGRPGKHARGRSRSPEHNGRFHSGENPGSDLDGDYRDRDAEKPRRRKHHTHSKSKVEGESAVSLSEDELKKKKKKHRKHRDEGSLVKDREDRGDVDIERTSTHRKHRSKIGSHGVSAAPHDLEDTRWQLDSGYDEILTSQAHRKSERAYIMKPNH